MKTMPMAWMIVVLILAGMPVQVVAQGGPPSWAGQGRGAGGAAAAIDDEFAALERFLAMSDAELDAMQQAIARVRAMSPEQRAAFREQLAAFHQLPENRRDEIRAGWGWHDAQDRDDWRTMMRAKSPDERATVQRELLALPAAERMARKHAMLEAWRKAGAGKSDTQPMPSP